MTMPSRLFFGLALASSLAAAVAVVAGQRPDLDWPAAWAGGGRPGPKTVLLVPGDPSLEAMYRAKGEVIRRLLDRELTLPQAAAWFRSLNRPLSHGGDPLASCAGKTEGERLCRQVIGWAKAQAEQQSASEAEVVGRRLEAELRTCLERDGGEVRLPEVE
jgi:hypothetical protein